MWLVEFKKDPNACPDLEAILTINSGESRYRCEWCEDQVLRKCHSIKNRDRRQRCPLDEYGHPKSRFVCYAEDIELSEGPTPTQEEIEHADKVLTGVVEDYDIKIKKR